VAVVGTRLIREGSAAKRTEIVVAIIANAMRNSFFIK
jgi:hypothetical protein